MPNNKGQIKSGTKIAWQQCDEAVLNTWKYDADNKQLVALNSALIVNEKGRPYCWSLNKKNLRPSSKNGAGNLKLKICNNSDARQKFLLDDGRIWLDFDFHSGKKFCVIFKGSGVVMLRRCFEDLA